MNVYISGPYTQGDMVANIRKAIEVADSYAALGHAIFIPHLSHFWHLISPHDYEFWLEQDLAWVAKCDLVVRINGYSPGGDREVARARELGIPVEYLT